MTATTHQLIPVFNGYIGDDLQPLINARELHEFLESKQDFSTWLKNRITQYDFVENQDYLLHKFVEQVPHQGGYRNREIIDYHLTLDMAKELSMVENNDKGKQARRYFINCEKQLYEVRQKVGAVKQIRTRIAIGKEINTLTHKIVNSKNAFELEILIPQLTDYCNLVGIKMPPLERIKADIEQTDLFLEGDK